NVTATFEIKDEKGTVLTTAQVDLTGSTCFPLNQKDYSEICTSSKETEGLIKLLNAMAGNGDIKPTGGGQNGAILINDNVGNPAKNVYNPDFSPYFKNYLNSLISSANNSNLWYFNSTAQGNSATINIAKSDDFSSAQGIRLVVVLSPENATTLPQKFDIANIRAISCFRSLGVANLFGVTATYFDPENAALAGSYDFKVSVLARKEGQMNSPDFPVLKCGPPKPEECKSVAHDNTDNLPVFLNQLQTYLINTADGGNGPINKTSINLDLSNFNIFNSDLKSQLGEDNYLLSDITSSSDVKQLNFHLCPVDISGTKCGAVAGSNVCDINLKFKDNPDNINFNKIIAYGRLKADYSSSKAGKAYNFDLVAFYLDPNAPEGQAAKQKSALLSGTSCFPVANCEINSCGGNQIKNGDFEDPTALPNGSCYSGSANIEFNRKSNYFSTDYCFSIPIYGNPFGVISLTKFPETFSDGNTVIPYKYATDHTTGNGYFMIIDGRDRDPNDNVDPSANSTKYRAWYNTVKVEK
ncbi:MAG TPA: hypothetical protein VF691_22530, partial [Cytophagaceae bacterium]